MNKKHLALISLIFLACLIVFSCRKDIKNIINDQAVSSTSLENARIWYAQNVDKSPNSLNPKWAESWVVKTTSGEILVVPAPEKEMNSKDYSIRRLLAFTLSGNQISQGVIMEFLGRKYDVASNLDKLVTNANKNTIEDFNGTIFTYDINYQQLGSAVFNDGIKLEAKSNLTTIRSKSLLALKRFSSQQRDSYDKQKIAAAFDFAGLASTTGAGQTCVTIREVVEYYTNGRLTDVKVFYYEVCTPNPPSSSGSGSNSSASGSSTSQPIPDYGGGSTGGGGGGGTTPTGSMYYSQQEMLDIINSLVNGLTGDPIELYLIAERKGNKLLNLSSFSVGTAIVTVGEYSLTPHYDSSGNLLFYAAFRNSTNGIEYIIKASHLSQFQNKINLYTTAANLVYISGKPSTAHVDMMAGNYVEGLANMWDEAFRTPTYYLYLGHIFIGATTNLNSRAAPAGTPQQPNTVDWSNVTVPNSNYPNYAINNMSWQQYKNALAAKHGSWQATSTPGVSIINSGSYRYVARPNASEWGPGFTIDYQRTTGATIGKFRFYN